MGLCKERINVDISVIIPVYNVSLWLRECLDSVISQTGVSFEIICVDDGSTDASPDILKQYGNQFSCVRVYTTPNYGLSAARNFGMGKANGKYTYFMDSDDYFAHNGVLSLMLDMMENQSLDILYFDAEVFLDTEGDLDDVIRIRMDEEQKIFGRPKSYGIFNHGYELCESMLKDHTLLSSIPLQCFRMKFLQRNDLKFYEGIIHEDLLFYYQSILLAHRVCHLNQKLYMRRLRANSITTKTLTFRNFYGRFVAWKYMIQFWDSHSFGERIDSIVKCVLKSLSSSAYSVYNQLDRDEKDMIYSLRQSEQYQIGILIDMLMKTSQFSSRDYVFPWELFQEGDKVAIWGAGRVGKCFYHQTKKFPHIEIVGIFDSNASNISTPNFPVMNMESLLNINYDYVLISVLDKSMATEIRHDLIARGILPEKIKWDGEFYEYGTFCRKMLNRKVQTKEQ